MVSCAENLAERQCFLISRPAENNTSTMVDLTQLESTQAAPGLIGQQRNALICAPAATAEMCEPVSASTRVAVHLVDQAIVLMGDQFQRAGDYPLSADPWMIHQRGRRLAEPLVHPGGRLRVISGDVVPDVEALLQRLGRPYDPHDW